MQNKFIDYAYSLDLLRTLNMFIESEPKLKAEFRYKEWNLLYAYQASMFGDMKVWSREKTITAVKPYHSIRLLGKVFVSGVIMSVISLISVVYIILSRKKVLVFSGDKIDGTFLNDFRLNTLYKVLIDKDVSYGEILHTLGGMKMIKNFTKRRRPIIYLESIEFAIFPFVYMQKIRKRNVVRDLDLSTFEERDRKFIKFELHKYLSSTIISKVRLDVLSIFFKMSAIESVISIDDTRHYNEIMASAQTCSIKTWALQHGHFTKYHAGWIRVGRLSGNIMRPQNIVVWSEYWKRELMRLNSVFEEENIVVGGDRHSLKLIPSTKTDKLCVLLPYEKDAPKAEVRAYIDRLLDSPNTELIFKLRADQEKQVQLEEYGLVGVADKISIVRSAQDVLERVSVAIGTYSTFLYDMVEQKRPVAILKTSIDYGEGMVVNGLAVLVDRDGDLEVTLRQVSKTPEEKLEEMRLRLVGTGDKSLENTIQDII